MKLVRSLMALAISVAMLAATPAAAAGVSADLSAVLQGTYTGSNALGSVAFTFNKTDRHQFSSGVTVGKADKLFSDARSIAPASTENLDLAGPLTDPFGAAITFAKVKAIYVKAKATNTNNLVLGGAGSNTFAGPFGDATDKISLPPGGTLMLVHPGAGWTVTAGTGDILLMANSGSGSAVAYEIVIIGTSS